MNVCGVWVLRHPSERPLCNRRTNRCYPQALTDSKGEGGKKQDTEENKLLKKEVQRLTEELKSSTDGEHKPYTLNTDPR